MKLINRGDIFVDTKRVWDIRGTYPTSIQIDPTSNISTDTQRVFRGQPYIVTENNMTCAQRSGHSGCNKSVYWGFRVARNNPADPRAVTFIKTYGGSEFDYAQSIISIESGYMICGSTYSFSSGSDLDISLLKIDKKGSKLWEKTIGNSFNESSYSIKATSDGGYIIAGVTDEAGKYDILIIKTDSAGNELWRKIYDNGEENRCSEIIEKSNGDFCTIGYSVRFGYADVCLVIVTSNGSSIYARNYGGTKSDYGYSLDETPDGGLIICGKTQSFEDSDGDVYLIKTDSTYTEQWTKTYGGLSFDSGQSIKVTADGGYIISSQGDYHLIKTDSEGNFQWGKNYGSNLVFSSVLECMDGNYFLSGSKYIPSVGGYAYYIKVDSNGNLIWEKFYDFLGKESLTHSVLQENDIGFVLCGNIIGDNNKYDYLVIKTDQNGNVMGSR